MLKENVDKRIRVYSSGDSKEILMFTKDLYESGYISYLLNYHKKNPKRTIPFILEDKKMIKAICFFHFSNEVDGWLMGMRVRKEYQKGGIASLFTEELVSYAKANRLEWIGLNTSFKNKSVHRICKSLEFDRYDAYYIIEFSPHILKTLRQRGEVELDGALQMHEVVEYFNINRIKRFLFVIDPGFIWIQLTDNILDSLIKHKSIYWYKNKLVILQRWSEFLVFNFFGKLTYIEFVNFLAQLYKEFPKEPKGRIACCIRKSEMRGMNQLLSKIPESKIGRDKEVELSDWFLFGKSLS